MSGVTFHLQEENLYVVIEEITFISVITEEHLDVQIEEYSIGSDISQDALIADIVEEHLDVELKEEHLDIQLTECIYVQGSGGSNIKSISALYDSDGSLLVGDLVYQDDVLEKYVIKVPDNNTVNPAIGVVQSLQIGSMVEVAHNGFFTVALNLRKGRTVFVSSLGDFTTDVPLTGFIQSLGVAISDNTVYLNPELRRVKRV